MPMRRALAASFVTSCPATRMLPASAAMKPARMRSSVVLPQPLGPSRQINSPLAICRSNSASTCRPAKDLLTPAISIAAIFSVLRFWPP